MYINIYDLIENSDKGKGRIKATLNNELRRVLNKELNDISLKPTEIAKILGTTYFSLWDYLNRRPSIPLAYIQKLERLSKFNFIKYVSYLEYGAGSTFKRVKAVKDVSEHLAKILGAHSADGYLRARTTVRSGREATHYELVIREGSKRNMISFCKWFKNVFDIDLKPKKSRNHWFVYISNKIIFRYFKNVFNFPSGRKSETVSTPKLILSAPLKIKKAFISGVLMFDGSVSYRTGYIELYSKSRELIRQASEILKELKIKPDYLKLEADKYGRYRLIIRKKKKIVRSLELFEPKTEKWQRIKTQIDGCSFKVRNMTELIEELNSLYPKVRPNTITFSDVPQTIKKLERKGVRSNYSNISKELKRHSTVIYEFLSKLEEWEILKSSKIQLKKIWRINKDYFLQEENHGKKRHRHYEINERAGQD